MSQEVAIERMNGTSRRQRDRHVSVCGETFSTQEELSKHLMDVHPDALGTLGREIV